MVGEDSHHQWTTIAVTVAVAVVDFHGTLNIEVHTSDLLLLFSSHSMWLEIDLYCYIMQYWLLDYLILLPGKI